jgi:hypothetical protein
MKSITFTKKSLYGAKDESREVTERCAVQFVALGIAVYDQEEKIEEVIEVKEEKSDFETKEEKIEVKTKGKAKITKAPKF